MAGFPGKILYREHCCHQHILARYNHHDGLVSSTYNYSVLLWYICQGKKSDLLLATSNY